MAPMNDSVDRKAAKKPPPGKPQGDGPPSITSGSFVSWRNGKGRVDLIVTNGKVPGVDGDIEGTPASPAARVVVWDPDGDGHKPSRKKIGAMVNTLRRIPPIKRAGTKNAPSATLVGLLADHEQKVADGALPDYAQVTGRAVKTVYDRGVASWPGTTVTVLSAEAWAVGRVKAFLTVAGGGQVKQYRRDRDLLHASHPAATATTEVKAAAPAPPADRVRLDADDVAATLATFDQA